MNTPAITAADAGTWRLGDREVNRLGFGAMRLPGRMPRDSNPPVDREKSIAVLRRALELGVNHIDTAAFYFSPLRSANELICTALAPYPDELVIVTKIGPGRDPWGEWYSARPDQLRGQVEENLRQLGRDHLDVVNLRRMRQTSISEHSDPRAERPRHPRHRRPRPPGAERGRGRACPVRRGSGPAQRPSPHLLTRLRDRCRPGVPDRAIESARSEPDLHSRSARSDCLNRAASASVSGRRKARSAR